MLRQLPTIRQTARNPNQLINSPLMIALKLSLPIILISALSVYGEKASEIDAPASFTMNCQACHMLDKVQVGPSLVEIAEIYPKSKLEAFIQWCHKPGKKRAHMPAMPAMVHIPIEDLNSIYDYIRKVTIGVDKVAPPTTDPYPDTERPRIIRHKLPNTGVASIAIALPTEKLHNIIWDTDKCRLRYISSGKIDSWPHVRASGASSVKVGTIIYKEDTPLFKSEKTQFLGYHLSKQGLPALIYTIEGKKLTETISLEDNVITRTIKGTPVLPDHALILNSNSKVETKYSRQNQTLTITHRQL